MQWSLVSAALVLFAATLARGYTVSVGPHNTQCFYQDATQPNSRILFEFAVVTGGNFDIDFTVKDPKGTVVHSGEAEKEGDFTFVAEPQGEYSFCFSNGMSTVSSKVIEFGVEVAGSGVYGARGVRKNPDAANTKQGADTTAIEQSIETLRNSLSSIQHHVNSYKHRERRNLDTAESTSSRVFWNTIAEVVLVVVVAVAQVFLLRSFFSTKKGRAI